MAELDENDPNKFGADYLPGLLGLNFTGIGEGWAEAELEVRQTVMAPNGYLHAGTVVTLADSACGYGCVEIWFVASKTLQFNKRPQALFDLVNESAVDLEKPNPSPR